MITKNLLLSLRPQIEAALKEIGKKNNVCFSMGSIRFTPESANFKLKLIESSGGSVVNPEMEALKRLYKNYGLVEENLNQVFKIGLDSYVLSGYKGSARKRPFLISRLRDEKQFVVDEKYLKDCLEIKTKPTLSLAEFTAEVNKLESPNGSPSHDEKSLKYYWEKGMSPQEVIQSWIDECKAEAKAEAAGS